MENKIIRKNLSKYWSGRNFCDVLLNDYTKITFKTAKEAIEFCKNNPEKLMYQS